jgi:hypothetical protein
MKLAKSGLLARRRVIDSSSANNFKIIEKHPQVAIGIDCEVQTVTVVHTSSDRTASPTWRLMPHKR